METGAAGQAGGGGPAAAAAAAGEYWSEALKSFLDHIPVSSVNGAIQPSPSPGKHRFLDSYTRRPGPGGALIRFWSRVRAAALEIRLDSSVPDAIDSMYRSGVAGAVIVDDVRTSFGKFVDRDIGFVEFPSLVLWAIEVMIDRTVRPNYREIPSFSFSIFTVLLSTSGMFLA